MNGLTKLLSSSQGHIVLVLATLAAVCVMGVEHVLTGGQVAGILGVTGGGGTVGALVAKVAKDVAGQFATALSNPVSPGGSSSPPSGMSQPAPLGGASAGTAQTAAAPTATPSGVSASMASTGTASPPPAAGTSQP